MIAGERAGLWAKVEVQAGAALQPLERAFAFVALNEFVRVDESRQRGGCREDPLDIVLTGWFWWGRLGTHRQIHGGHVSKNEEKKCFRIRLTTI